MEIAAEQQAQLNQIGPKYDLKLLLLHGSYATGKQRPGSDLDLAYLRSRKLDFDEELQLSADLAEAFGNNEERELDVKSLHHVGYLFEFEVARDSQLLYGDEFVYNDFRAHAFAQYFDNHALRGLRNLLTRKLLKRLSLAYDKQGVT